VAREVLLSWTMKTGKGRNPGEGDKVSARQHDREVREFIADGRVDEAAFFVEPPPAEARARKNPHATKVSVDELVAKGRTLIERVRPFVDRVVDSVRSRLHLRSS